MPADVQWVCGDTLVCDPHCAWKGGAHESVNRRELVVLGPEKATQIDRSVMTRKDSMQRITKGVITDNTDISGDGSGGGDKDANKAHGFPAEPNVSLTESVEVTAGAVVLAAGLQADGQPSARGSHALVGVM